MAIIKFKGIAKNEIENMETVFDFIAERKRCNALNNVELAKLLGTKHKSKFWWPSEEERDDWMRRWQETSVETRHTDPSLKVPWDFDSWIEAFQNAEIDFVSLKIDENGDGQMKYEQLAWPSGGIEATEEIIKMFDGEIVSNDAI